MLWPRGGLCQYFKVDNISLVFTTITREKPHNHFKIRTPIIDKIQHPFITIALSILGIEGTLLKIEIKGISDIHIIVLEFKNETEQFPLKSAKR